MNRLAKKLLEQAMAKARVTTTVIPQERLKSFNKEVERIAETKNRSNRKKEELIFLYLSLYKHMNAAAAARETAEKYGGNAKSIRSNLAKRTPPELKVGYSAPHKGKPLTEEHRRHMSEAQAGRERGQIARGQQKARQSTLPTEPTGNVRRVLGKGEFAGMYFMKENADVQKEIVDHIHLFPPQEAKTILSIISINKSKGGRWEEFYKRAERVLKAKEEQ